ncbi:MAG: hypothetical protein SXQ77_12570, partial [Halobacteria archaeon]|nr:hypothetical protein [Halobacteria archaeon]
MGSFEDHMRYGIASYVLVLLVGGGVVGYLVYTGSPIIDSNVVLLAVVSGGIALPFTIAGAGFPDIDHHASKPHRWFRKWFSISATGAS